MSEACKKSFAAQVIPYLKFETKSKIRAACTQVLFSAVYHLGFAVLPYASGLLRIALKALRKKVDKERIVGAKLITSLMAREDVSSMKESLDFNLEDKVVSAKGVMLGTR